MLRAHSLRVALALGVLVAAACHRGPTPDAFGNFEATEVVVSAQTSGQLERFTPVEGARLARGALVALVDTTQLALQRGQLAAQREAAFARRGEAAWQRGVLVAQRDIAQRAYERTRRLFAEKAATAQQLDQAERDYRVLLAQIAAAEAQLRSAGYDAAASASRAAQLRDQLAKSTVENPEPGTVLAVYARAGEVVQPGQPLYRIANLDTLVLRAYVSGAQLAAVRIGRRVDVHVTREGDEMLSVPGVVTWVASKAEFTPTPVETRDERADLVYAIKVRVANPDGVLKIGMPADLTFGAPRDVATRDRSR